MLRYYLGPDNTRVYTLEKYDAEGKPTLSAHPARFSPSDTYSKYRMTTKARFGLLPTQAKEEENIKIKQE